PGTMYNRAVSPRYRITDPANRELASGVIAISQRGSGNNPYQIGLLSRTAASSDDFGMPTGLNGQEIRFGRFTPETLPDRWIGLAALDALVIHDAAFDEFTPDQARALSDYIRIGGTLILGPGVTKGWFAHPVLSAFVKIRAGEPQLVTRMPRVNDTHGNFRNNAEPFLVHPLQNGEPFKENRYEREIVQFPTGFGRVIVLSFDVLRAP